MPNFLKNRAKKGIHRAPQIDTIDNGLRIHLKHHSRKTKGPSQLHSKVETPSLRPNGGARSKVARESGYEDSMGVTDQPSTRSHPTRAAKGSINIHLHCVGRRGMPSNMKLRPCHININRNWTSQLMNNSIGVASRGYSKICKLLKRLFEDEIIPSPPQGPQGNPKLLWPALVNMALRPNIVLQPAL